MKKNNVNYKVWQGLYLSFYSRAFYRYVAEHWRWKSLWFMLLLLCLVWLPITVRVSMNFNYLSSAMVSDLAKQLPVINIKNGIASTETSGPFYINYPGTKNVFAVIDTRNQYKNFANDDSLILITNNAMIIKSLNNKFKTYVFNPSWNRVLSSKELVKLYNSEHRKTLTAAVISIYIFGYLLFFAICAIYFAVLSVFISLFFNWTNAKPPVNASLSVVILAMTPVLIIFSLLYLFKLAGTLAILLLLILQFIYLLLATYYIKSLYKNNK
ncbi:MAG: hypothetical protein A3E87_01145 [Gammaproteobacteria bacterium RIFCSPHIGHO2_12_FULL_35_23]|nr:MAG: hypothetical protein A3E87_01145 [Gammaproteobacteria bacterium RIFCSPHIGHO2_12_FULL_35_23]